MLCPSCKTELVSSSAERFETLSDHVCNPNGTPPVRPTVCCPNANCEAMKDGVFWDAQDGEGPYNTKYGKDYRWIDTNPTPFDSWSRQSYFSTYYHEEDRKWCNRLFMVRREVHYNSNKHGDKVGKRTHYSFWTNKNGAYIHYTSGISMLLFVLKRFYNLKKMGEKWQIDEAKNIVSSAKWPRAEWWRKVASWWVRTFHGTLLETMTIRISRGKYD